MGTYWYDMSKTIRGIEVTRYVASWYIAGGKPNIHAVRKWLRSLEINGGHFTEDEVEAIAQCVVMGKLELQENAKKFLA